MPAKNPTKIVFLCRFFDFRSVSTVLDLCFDFRDLCFDFLDRNWVCFDFVLDLCFNFLRRNWAYFDFLDLCFDFLDQNRVFFDFGLDSKLLLVRGFSVVKLQVLDFQSLDISREPRPRKEESPYQSL